MANLKTLIATKTMMLHKTIILLVHDCGICTGHLENIGPLRYTDLKNVDIFMQYMKITVFNIITNHQKRLKC